MNKRLNRIFEIISFYDKYRWKSEVNYNLINFFRDDLDADTKILTHWICYITDRQMPFQRIWHIGGFVFSELIYEIKEHKKLNILNPENENSFVKKENDKFTFISKSIGGNNPILAQYNEIWENGRVKFKSRFFPSDYMAILNTLVVLQDYDFSFSRFIKDIYCNNKDKNDFIKRILFSLHLLTYYEVKRPESSDLNDFANNLTKAEERKNMIKEILCNSDKFDDEFDIFRQDKIFSQKRAWCSLRDYLKSPEFKEYFELALTKEELNPEYLKRLFQCEAYVQLELPGDVWNNNSAFRNCILKDTEYEQSKEPLNKILRKYYNKHLSDKKDWYPEQFDMTFDFVPRMCNLKNCEICPIGRINNLKENELERLCVDNEDMYCPVILVSCNYKGFCKGKDSCKLI